MKIAPDTQRPVTQRIFDHLRMQILDLTLPPGAKLSEAVVANQFGTSRQPVRDAFFRLGQQGFLTIRPQRATIVAPFSAEGVQRAKFVRMALELEVVRLLAAKFSDADDRNLTAICDMQKAAARLDDLAHFHELDEFFHKEIFRLSGTSFVWDLIVENKSHMDRIRVATLGTEKPDVIADHDAILEALRQRSPELASVAMRQHLSRIDVLLDDAQINFPHFFEGGA